MWHGNEQSVQEAWDAEASAIVPGKPRRAYVPCGVLELCTVQQRDAGESAEEERTVRPEYG